MENKIIEKAISKSQHCQRNWDLEKNIPDADLQTMVTSVTECPSKQNEAFYKVIIVKDRNKIEKIHETTDGFTFHDGTKDTISPDGWIKQGVKTITNSQTLANILFVFLKDTPKSNRSTQVAAVNLYSEQSEGVENEIEKQRNLSVGIASGYLNLTASLLEYNTGCCSCFDSEKIEKILDCKDPILLMGIGYRDKTRSRLEHHKDSNIRFRTFKKVEIEYMHV